MSDPGSRRRTRRSTVPRREPAQKRKWRSGRSRSAETRKRDLLALDIHAIEGVAREGRKLVVDDLLADRHQLNGMGDREPGRLFLEDRLGLLVELGALGLVGGDLRLHDDVVERLIAPLRDVRARRLL